MPFRIGPVELIVILLLALLIFGPGRIARLGSELGKGIRGFQEGLQGEKKVPPAEEADDQTGSPQSPAGP